MDFAQLLREVIDEQYPQAEAIVLGMDNLHTRKPASLSEAFGPAEARRSPERMEIHYTFEHDSWLNRAETELSMLTMPCVARRMPDYAEPGSCRLGTTA